MRTGWFDDENYPPPVNCFWFILGILGAAYAIIHLARILL